MINTKKSKDGGHHPLLPTGDWPRCLLHRLPGKTEKCKFKKTLNVISGFGGLYYPQLLLSLSKAVLTADAYKDRKLTLSSVRRCLENKMEKVLAQGMLMLFVYFCCVFVHTAGDVDVILQLLLFAVNAPQQCELASLIASAAFRDFPNNRHLFLICYFRDFPNNRSSFHICASCSRSRDEWPHREVEE